MGGWVSKSLPPPPRPLPVGVGIGVGLRGRRKNCFPFFAFGLAGPVGGYPTPPPSLFGVGTWDIFGSLGFPNIRGWVGL